MLRIPLRIALVALAVVAAVAIPGRSQAVAADTLYSTPHPGMGATCSAAEPCSLAAALAMAVDGGTVVVGVGTYTPTASYSDDSKSLTIKGAVIGIGRPVVHGDMSLTGPLSLLSDVEIDNNDSASAIDLADGARADRVIGVNAVGDACELDATGSTISNSLCVSNNIGSNSGLATQGQSGTMAAHNMTLIGHYGFFANAGTDSTDPGLTMSDSIMATNSGGTDAQFDFGQTTLLNTDYVSTFTSGEGSVVSTNHRTAPPVFRGPTDFREASTSPTIGAGSDAANQTELDLDGNLRRIGAVTDMGAYEFVSHAPAVTGRGSTLTAPRSATVMATINPESAQTYYHLEYGPKAAHGKSTATKILPATGTAPVTFTLTGLRPGSTIHYSVVATSDGGTTVTKPATFQVPRHPASTIRRATHISSSGATLHGRVKTGSVRGIAYFELMPAGGSRLLTASKKVSNGAVSLILHGLRSKTTYRYALVVQTTGGHATSAKAKFRTR
jgi:hypothetical protein